MTNLTSQQQVRVAALQAAASFCAPVADSSVADVLNIAERFESYIQAGAR